MRVAGPVPDVAASVSPTGLLVESPQGHRQVRRGPSTVASRAATTSAMRVLEVGEGLSAKTMLASISGVVLEGEGPLHGHEAKTRMGSVRSSRPTTVLPISAT